MNGTNVRRAAAVGQRVLVVLMLGLLVSGLASLRGGAVASAARTPLRQVDWLAVIKNDSAITIDPDAYKLPGGDWPYVTVDMAGLPDGPVSGYALIDDVEYGDLDGDGADEAIIMLESGGTGGAFGFVLYREADFAPQLVLAKSGYKLGTTIEGGKLVVVQPYYVGFEANCCPSAIDRTLNSLQGDELVTVASETVPNDVQEPTVWSFYRALSDKEYEAAYEFFSPAMKAANPFDRWKAGYAATQRIEVETAPGATPNEVQITLTSVDSQPGGGTKTQRFQGTWTLVWSADQKRWLLDKASIRAA